MFDGLVAELRPYARELYERGRAIDSTLVVTSVRRSRRQQARLYRRFLAGQSRFPALPPGQSKHERGLAFDMVGRPLTLWLLGKLWESWGGTWGGKQDPIHFEA